MDKDEGLFFSNTERIRALKERSSTLPDKHAECPDIRIHLPIVGLSHLEKWFRVEIAGEIGILKVDIEATIDLPSTMRGFNISRHNEVIDEIAASSYVSEKPVSIESLSGLIAQQLLMRHEYSMDSCVSVKTPYPYSHKTPNGIQTQQNCKVIFTAWGRRVEGNPVIIKHGIAVTVESVLSCPLARAMIQTDAKETLSAELTKHEVEKTLELLPLGTHMERCFSTLEIASSTKFDFRVNHLIDILENAASAPLFELLKRPDELEVVKTLLSKNRFVEDSTREVALNVLKLCHNLPKETSLRIKFESLFPLAKYHVVSVLDSNLGEIEKEIF